MGVKSAQNVSRNLIPFVIFYNTNIVELCYVSSIEMEMNYFGKKIQFLKLCNVIAECHHTSYKG